MGRTRPLRRAWGFGCLRGRGGAEVRSVGATRLCGGCADVFGLYCLFCLGFVALWACGCAWLGWFGVRLRGCGCVLRGGHGCLPGSRLVVWQMCVLYDKEDKFR
jgi:hypothetical protein